MSAIADSRWHKGLDEQLSSDGLDGGRERMARAVSVSSATEQNACVCEEAAAAATAATAAQASGPSQARAALGTSFRASFDHSCEFLLGNLGREASATEWRCRGRCWLAANFATLHGFRHEARSGHGRVASSAEWEDRWAIEAKGFSGIHTPARRSLVPAAAGGQSHPSLCRTSGVLCGVGAHACKFCGQQPASHKPIRDDAPRFFEIFKPPLRCPSGIYTPPFPTRWQICLHLIHCNFTFVR
ncbi:hypothetical protein K440DRAFT_146099 [Wilcoxina mikolae CBS 423.85]|nr:hypothetical protein K440DRAFT_146099 [Wilcoxina mikolae CBS 423.85]